VPTSGLIIQKTVRVAADPAFQARKLDILRTVAAKYQSKARTESMRRTGLGPGVVTGRLVESIQVIGPLVFSTGKSTRITIYASRKVAPHALWQEEGTGIYGPAGTPIVSPTGKKMSWTQVGRAYRGPFVKARIIAKTRIGSRKTAKGRTRGVYENTYQQFASQVKGSRPKRFMASAGADPAIAAYYQEQVAALARTAIRIT